MSATRGFDESLVVLWVCIDSTRTDVFATTTAADLCPRHGVTDCMMRYTSLSKLIEIAAGSQWRKYWRARYGRDDRRVTVESVCACRFCGAIGQICANHGSDKSGIELFVADGFLARFAATVDLWRTLRIEILSDPLRVLVISP